MTSLGNIVYLVKCLSKPYLKHFFDCKMFIAATALGDKEYHDEDEDTTEK